MSAPKMTPAEARVLADAKLRPMTAVYFLRGLTGQAVDDGSRPVVEGMFAALETLLAEHEALKAKLETLEAAKPAEPVQPVPSDEEIRDAIESVHMCGDNVTAHALCSIAKRIGVKL